MSKSYDDNKKDKYQLTELFLVAADIHRTFPATILSKHDDNDQEYFIGVVIINEGEVIGRAKSQAELENQLDDLCKMKLDCGLHQTEAISSVIFYGDCFHN